MSRTAICWQELLHLSSNAPAKRLNKSSVVIMTAESLPHIKTHINRLLIACVLVGNDSLACHTVVCHGNDLTTKLVVLGLAIFVKDARGHSNKGHFWVDIFEIGADTASTILVKDLAAF